MTDYPTHNDSEGYGDPAEYFPAAVRKGKTVRDITNGQLGSWVLANHASYYTSFNSYMFSYVLAKEFYNKDFGYAFPSIKKLAATFDMSERQVQYHIKALRDARDADGKPLWEVERGYNTRNGKTMANRYFPLFLRDVLKGKPKTDDSENLDGIKWEGRDADLATDEEFLHEENELVKTELSSPTNGEEYTGFDLPAELPQDENSLVREAQKVERIDAGVLNSEIASGIDRNVKDLMKSIISYCNYLTPMDYMNRELTADSLISIWREEGQFGVRHLYREGMAKYLNRLIEAKPDKVSLPLPPSKQPLLKR